MNYIVLRPAGAMLVVSIDAFSCIYYTFVDDEVMHNSLRCSADNFIQTFIKIAKAPVIITDITSVDELTSLHPELFI